MGTCEDFKKTQNMKKNRFSYIPCWDASRVTIFETADGRDYINANYVDGFNLKRKFIATELPTPATVNDFWTMVWQENTHVIVMLNGTEESQFNVYPYFYSDANDAIFGNFIIKVKEINLEYDYIETVISMTEMQTGKSRIITHLKYLSWPENIYPTEESFLQFLLNVNRKQHKYYLDAVKNKQLLPGPIVVHGNAGIGRTASFCAIDNCLYQLVNTKTMSIPATVHKIRQQRNCSFPTFHHYLFIYDILFYFLIILESQYEIFMELRYHCIAKDLYLLCNSKVNLIDN